MTAVLAFLRSIVGRFGVLSALIPGAGIMAGAASLLSLGSLSAMLAAGLNFFSTPLGRAVAVVVLCLGSYAAGDIHRGRGDAAKWDAAVQAADKARSDRDTEIKAEAAKEAAAAIADIRQENDTLKQKVADYEARPSDTCRAGAAAARRLRGL